MPELLYINGTRKTPSVTLDPEGIIKIQGRSIPEDASIFFDKIIKWLNEYVSDGSTSTRVDMAFEYLNSGTSKYILQMLQTLKDQTKPDHKLVINWFYENGDDDIFERGEYYSTILGIKINLIETE